MKIIKIEIHEAPNGFARPVIEMPVYPKINPTSFDALDTLDYNDSYQVTKDIYPLEGMALGKYHQEFYIRKKDKQAFEEMIKGFVDKATSSLLQELIDYGRKNPDYLWNYILEKVKFNSEL